MPADSAMLPRVPYIREQLDTHVLAARCWVDTCDMLTDGITKGVVDRVASHQITSGTVVVNCEAKLLSQIYQDDST